MKNINKNKWLIIAFCVGILSVFEGATTVGAAQIIADHTIVADYDKIPQFYIDRIKTIMVDIAGESHSAAYADGLELLAADEPKFAVNSTWWLDSKNPKNALWITNFRWNGTGCDGGAGEATYYTNAAAISGITNTIQYCNENEYPLAVIGFGWCWDMSWINGPGGGLDPDYHVHWAGASEGGPDGNKIWGLDAGDYSLTNNHVCMDTYLNAVETYRQFCESHGYATVPIFTTGPVDSYSGENGVQREIKQQYIRNFVKENPNRVLFDYADILVYNDAGVKNEQTWSGNGYDFTYAQIHPDNMTGVGTGHIGGTGAIRLAKAMWWMLARLQGWDGTATTTYTISGTILDDQGDPLSGVTMTGLPRNTVTNASGDYSALVNEGSSITVIPTLTGYTFDPDHRDYTNISSNQNNQDYTATPVPTYSISGWVTYNGSGLAGVSMDGLPGNPLTDASGDYSVEVNADWSGTVTPSFTDYTFTPASRTYPPVTANQPDQDYTATYQSSIVVNGGGGGGGGGCFLVSAAQTSDRASWMQILALLLFLALFVMVGLNHRKTG
jgi:hypothetical protein